MTNPPKEFQTPLGVFRYGHVLMDYHALGMIRIEFSGTGFLMASPERALCDRLLEIPGLYRPNRQELNALLFDELRVDEESLAKLDMDLVEQLASRGQSPRLHQLHSLLREHRMNHE